MYRYNLIFCFDSRNSTNRLAKEVARKRYNRPVYIDRVLLKSAEQSIRTAKRQAGVQPPLGASVRLPEQLAGLNAFNAGFKGQIQCRRQFHSARFELNFASDVELAVLGDNAACLLIEEDRSV